MPRSDGELLEQAKRIVSGIGQQQIIKSIDGDCQQRLVATMRELAAELIRKEKGILMPGLSQVAAHFAAGFGNCQEHAYQGVLQLLPLTHKVTALFLSTRGSWNHTLLFAGDINYPDELHLIAGRKLQWGHQLQEFLRSQPKGVVVDPFYGKVFLASDRKAVIQYTSFCCDMAGTDQICVGGVKDYSKNPSLQEQPTIDKICQQTTELGNKFRVALLKRLLESATGLSGWKYTVQKEVGKFYHVADDATLHCEIQSNLKPNVALSQQAGKKKTAGKSFLFARDQPELALKLQRHIDMQQSLLAPTVKMASGI
jgi:hypothetical protein